MDKITEFCTGCRTCEQLCAHRAISMKPNDEGFLEAIVNNDLCINCGLCLKRCPQNNKMASFKSKQVLAVRNKNDEELKYSASGGAFAAIARYVLSNNGVVFGAAYNTDLRVVHIRVDNLSELIKLQSSKYVQSDTQETYSEVKELIRSNVKVLYSGTPCQIGGLYAFLGKESKNENLLTIDIICHGVASPLLFEKYLLWLGQKMKGEIIFYDFRTKEAGWGLDYKAKAKTKAKTKTKSAALDPYYYHFLKGDTYRECCYRCKYSQCNRVSDITIGDYWGIEQEHKNFFSTKGVSVILLNTDKAIAIRPIIDKLFFTIDSTFEKAARKNHNLNSPTQRNQIRDHIYDGLNNMMLENYISRKLAPPFQISAVLKNYMPIKLKLWLKRLK